MTDGAPVVAGVNVGDVVASRYRILEVLGADAAGVVVVARHVQLDDKVAIRFLRPELVTNVATAERLRREARAAARLRSAHVMRVVDVGQLNNGAPYWVTEYLEGTTLSRWVRAHGTSIEQAVEFVLQACEAVAEAHAMGMVHQYLTPESLFVHRRADGKLSVKVLDFGISRTLMVSNASGDSATAFTSELAGSLSYMSPEQLAAAPSVDSRTDIWALGVVLYELIAGAPPFIGASYPALVLEIMQTRPDTLRQLRPDVQEGLEAVVLRCLEKDRNRRFDSVAALVAALVPYAPGRARDSFERITHEHPPPSDRDERVASSPSYAPSASPRAGRMIPLPFTMLLLAVFLIVYVVRSLAEKDAGPSTKPVPSGAHP